MAYVTDNLDDKITDLLNRGGIGLLPTDTIYGLSCVALNRVSVEKLHKLKRRAKNKPFVVLISQTAQLRDLGIITTDAAPALKYWPGKLTLVCDALKAPSWLHVGTHTLAVRLPDHTGLRSLIDKTGPLISTSANLAGGKPAVSAAEAENYFKGELDFYVDIGKLAGQPSTIAKSTFSRLTIIRPGAVKIDEKELS